MKTLLLAISLLFLVTSEAPAQVCQCEKISCSPCESEAGLEFYTAPCEGGRVKSCSKPKCRPIASATGACADKSVVEAPTHRQPASVALERVQISVGTVDQVLGNLWVHREIDGNIQKISDVKKGFKVQESDTLETDETSRARILFVDSNILVVAPASKVKISKHQYNPKQKQNSTVLDLAYGQVINSIDSHNHYDQKQNVFEVKTRSAVAGVRGTIFSTSFHEGNSEKTEIETLHGLVALRSTASGEEQPVAKGYRLALNVEHKGSEAQSFFSMPIKMGENEVRELNSLIKFDAPKTESRKPTTSDVDTVAKAEKPKVTCQTPTADYNQCSWHCAGNPKKEKTCRIDLPGVSCQRHRCAANGEWVDEKRLPASFGGDCPAQGFKVKECDY